MRGRAIQGACLVVAGLGLAGCAEPCAGPGTRVRFDPTAHEPDGTAETWLAFPFPADHRRVEGGTIRLADYPNPDDTELVRTYARAGEEVLDGFGTNGPIYLAFDGPLDLASLPVNPGVALATNAPLQLVDIDPSSPELGRRRPLRLETWPTSGRYVAANMLAAAPVWGTPLRERTRYALLVTDAVRGADGQPLSAPPLLRRLLGEDIPAECVEPAVGRGLWRTLDDTFAPLRRFLTGDSLDAKRIAAATVFTTQSITGELATIRAQVDETAITPAADGWQLLAPPTDFARRESFPWNSTETVDYWVFEGRYSSPNYQWGQIPYAGPRDGGGFQWQDGAPVPSRSESIRFVLTVPTAPPADGMSCYPVVEYAHGTGGDAYSLTNGTAGRLAARGLAGISIDQPLHGPRGGGSSFDVELMTFNPLNPASARSIFRQSAIDSFALTQLVRGGLSVPAAQSPTGESICLAATPLGFFGHSQGGLSGSIAAAFEANVKAWVLSGAGGGLSMTLMQRKDIMDFAAFFSLLLYLEPADEPLSELHPAIGLIQMLMDITDPINYAPHWLAGVAPKSVLLTSGEHDAATPYLTASALAVAGRVPVVEPVEIPIPAYGWLGLASVSAPVVNNTPTGTAGFLQWTRVANRPDYDSHFVIFHRPEAIHASMSFLRSAAFAEAPVIERIPMADVR